MVINQKKSFTQGNSKEKEIPACSIKMDEKIFKQVENFIVENFIVEIYLGSLITFNSKSDSRKFSESRLLKQLLNKWQAS